MSHDPCVRSFDIAGVPVSALTMPGLICAVERRLALGADQPGTFVVFRDAHGVVRAQDDPELLAAHREALLVCPDGVPMVWIGRLLGFREISQVSGIESVETLCRAGVDLGWRHYFIGGGPGVAQGLAAEMQARVPGLVVAGVETPPFRKMTEREASEMRQRIRSSNAQIVWVGLSTPKQELWMSENAPHLPGTISFGVGAGFDVNIGSIPRAPRALRVVGLEWLYRLLKEPKRLSRRYTEVVPRFALLALKRLVNFG